MEGACKSVEVCFKYWLSESQYCFTNMSHFQWKSNDKFVEHLSFHPLYGIKCNICVRYHDSTYELHISDWYGLIDLYNTLL